MKVYVVFWDWCDGCNYKRGIHKIFQTAGEALREASSMNKKNSSDDYGYIVQEWKLS